MPLYVPLCRKRRRCRTNVWATVVLTIGFINIALLSLRRQRVMGAVLRHTFDVRLSFRKPLHGITVT